MENRKIAFLLDNNDNIENVKTQIDFIISSSIASNDSIEVFSTIDTTIDGASMNKVEKTLTRGQIRNLINNYYKNSGFKGFLHVIHDTVQLKENSIKYIEKLEHTMDVLDYSVHFSTYSDPCNFVYQKFNPRVTIHMDDEKFSALGISDSLMFTSNANIEWVVYDFSKVEDDLLRFDDRFNIPMYLIIEFLARRRNTKQKNSLYYMNQYLSIPEEYNSYAINQGKDTDTDVEAQMKSNDEIFKSMNIDYHPDNNIDAILEDIYSKLISKI